MRIVFQVLVISLLVVNIGLAQSAAPRLTHLCEGQPAGTFGQVTNVTYKLLPEYEEIFFNKDSDLRDKRWTLDPLDEVNPTYKFLLEKTEIPRDKKCDVPFAVSGELVAPTGKLFDFKLATYSIVSRKLMFTTIERDGIIYEGDIQFFPAPVEVGDRYKEGIWFQYGIAKLKAHGKKFGIATIEFPFAHIGRE